MAENEFNKLQDKKVALSQKVLKAKHNIKNATRIVEDPDSVESDRSKYRTLLEKYKKDLAGLEKEYDSTIKDMTAVEGDMSVKGYQDKYAKLKRKLDLQLDPESNTAVAIQKEIDDLVPGFQSAYSKSVGAQVSPAVAKSKLFGTKVPTFSTPEGGEVSDVASETPSSVTPSTVSAEKINKGQQPKGTPSGSDAGKDKEKTKKKTSAQLEAEALNSVMDLNLPETLFKNIPSLQLILEKYSDPKTGMTNDELRKAIRDDVWYKQNSAEIKQRYIQLYNYRDLVKSGQAKGATDYEKQIATLTRQLENKAREIGSGAASDPEALRRAAENMYITNQSIEDPMTIDFLASSIRPMTSMIAGRATEGYSGKALGDYQTLQSIARKNGFAISDIVPGAMTEQQVLRGVATGTIDINRVAQDARKLAAQGQPQYVRDLLGQGYDLFDVYAPYRQTMANILEIGDAEQIDLNDPTLRMAITDKGDMNLYDFKKALRQDDRWQYTSQAKADVSQAALQVLRDFGFQG
jgi:uncharacterized protein YukE